MFLQCFVSASVDFDKYSNIVSLLFTCYCCQDCAAYAMQPLHAVGLLEAAHQYSLRDVHSHSGICLTEASQP
jgi:hypothetical protein